MTRSRPRRVRGVLLRLLIVLCTALVLTGATAVIGIQAIRHEVTQTRTTIIPLLDTSQELRSALLRTHSAVHGYALTQDASFVEEYQLAATDLEREHDRFIPLAQDRLEPAPLQRFTTEIDSWLAATEPVATGSSGDATNLHTSAQDLDRALAALEELDQQITSLHEDSHTNLQHSLNLSLGAVVLVAALSAAATLWALRRVNQLLALPLQRLQKTVARQRGGDCAARADTASGAVEVADVAHAFNQYCEEAQTKLIDVAYALTAYSAQAEELAEQRQQAIDKLRELDQQKSEFLSTTNHELRTPLTSITGYLEMLEDGDFGDLNPEQRHALGIVQRNTRRLQLLIEDVLLINRMDAGPSRERCDPLDLADCVKTVVVNLTPQATQGGIGINATTGGPWPVTGDRERLERAITNVVSNAIKFTPSGGEVELTLETGNDQTTVRFHCTDTGMGIPAQDLDTLFTNFARASNATAQHIPGTGLGLVIVRTITEEHGGRVELDSVENQGTHVMLELPLTTKPGVS
jgi:two-component system OmpR family sensor kinase